MATDIAYEVTAECTHSHTLDFTSRTHFPDTTHPVGLLSYRPPHSKTPNATNYRLLTADGQPWHIDQGLLTVGNRIMV